MEVIFLPLFVIQVLTDLQLVALHVVEYNGHNLPVMFNVLISSGRLDCIN